MSFALKCALAAAILLTAASPSMAQQEVDVRIVPSIGAGPQLGVKNEFFGSLHALVEAEIERGELAATPYIQRFAVASCVGECTGTRLGLMGSTRKGSLLIGAGFGLGLDEASNVFIGRAGIEPGPLRIQIRPEVLFDNDLIILMPVLLGIRLPW